VKIKLYIFFLFFVGQTFLILPQLHAQQNKFKQNGIDSAAIDSKIQAEKARRDSIAQAIIQKRKADSTTRELAKLKLEAFRDSIASARNAKRKADSMLKEQAKFALLEKKRISDSLTQDRIRKQDSTTLARKELADSVRLARLGQEKQRNALEKYRNSKSYKDSLQAIKDHRSDSIASARNAIQEIQKTRNQQVRDSLFTARNNFNDSVKAIRNHINDSASAAVKANIDKIRTERERVNDSLATVRKNRADSLATVRKAREKKGEETAKKKEEKQKSLAIKLLHDKKQEEWTNEKLLKRKWSIQRRIYQNTVTRYNYFYNARRKYDDAIRNLKKNNKDDYTKIISLEPYDVRKSGTSVAGDMDSVIKKSSFSTQIHDPRSKWFDNLYFLMGRASYIKNDFDGAITTFQFIANEYKETPTKKKKAGAIVKKDAKDPMSIATIDNRKGIRQLRHHPIRNQALVWLAKSYTQAEQYGEAAALISTLEKDKTFPKRNRADLYLAKASLEIVQNNNKDAIASLEKVLDYKLPSSQRARTEFVIGQLYAEDGNYTASSDHYKKSISGKGNPEMDFYTKLFIAQNAAKGGGDKQFAINQLDKIIKDSRFEKYKSLAYNALAAIYAGEDPSKAIDILNKSIKSMDAKNPLQKATSFAMLGELYYARGDYESAKTSYDSAAHYGTNPPLENISEVNTRKNVLTEVVKNIRIIRREDSLLSLSQKSEKEQKAIARKEAERLRKLEKPVENSTQVVALSPGTTTKSNWYFYNNVVMEKGVTEFKQKWGARKLEDNWRRSAASSNMIAVSGDPESQETENKLLINGSQYETLLAEIPKTPVQKATANDLISTAYYDLGLIYYAQLQDYKNSVSALDSLLGRYPSTTHKKETYYTLFLDNSLLKNEAEAARYRKLLQDEFGQSEFAKLATDPDYKEDLKDIEKAVDYYYDTTYMAYKDARYPEALDRIRVARNNFKGKPIMAKFDLLEAVCNAALKDYATCKTNLQGVISKHPSTPEQAKAQELLNYMNSTNILNDSTSVASNLTDSLNLNQSEIKDAEGKGVYAYNANDQHLLLVYINKVDGRTMALKSGLSDFNVMKHESEELATGQNLFTVKEGIVTVSKFSNAVFAKIYMNDVMKDQNLFKQFTKEDYNVCLISSQNFSELIKTRDILGYLDFYRKNYK